MFASRPFCLLVIVQYNFIQTVLSAPHEATHNVNNDHIKISPLTSSLTTLHTLNITRLKEDSGIRYDVPNTMTTLYFHLGFPCKEAGIRNTINSARDYCEQQLEHGGDSPLPRSETPFHEDLGYGAAINVVPARPDVHLTWGILKNAMNGLWDFLVIESRDVESDFEIYNGTLDLVGRGTVREAPETKFARQSRKREDVTPLGSNALIE